MFLPISNKIYFFMYFLFFLSSKVKFSNFLSIDLYKVNALDLPISHTETVIYISSLLWAMGNQFSPFRSNILYPYMFMVLNMLCIKKNKGGS